VLAEIIWGLDQWRSNLSKWSKSWIYADCCGSYANYAISSLRND